MSNKKEFKGLDFIRVAVVSEHITGSKYTIRANHTNQQNSKLNQQKLDMLEEKINDWLYEIELLDKREAERLERKEAQEKAAKLKAKQVKDKKKLENRAYKHVIKYRINKTTENGVKCVNISGSAFDGYTFNQKLISTNANNEGKYKVMGTDSDYIGYEEALKHAKELINFKNDHYIYCEYKIILKAHCPNRLEIAENTTTQFLLEGSEMTYIYTCGDYIIRFFKNENNQLYYSNDIKGGLQYICDIDLKNFSKEVETRIPYYLKKEFKQVVACKPVPEKKKKDYKIKCTKNILGDGYIYNLDITGYDANFIWEVFKESRTIYFSDTNRRNVQDNKGKTLLTYELDYSEDYPCKKDVKNDIKEIIEYIKKTY